MGFIAEIIKILPEPWNYITVFLLLGIFMALLGVFSFLSFRIVKNGFSFGKFSVSKDPTADKKSKGNKSVTLSEDNIDKLFRVFINTITTTIQQTQGKRMADKMEVAEGKLGAMYTFYKKQFFKLLREKDVDERVITAHDDYITFDLTLRTALYLHNGTECFKSLIKGELKDQVYRDKTGNEYDEFLNNLGSRFHTVFSKAFESAYRNATYYGENKDQIFRLVSVEDVYKMFDDTWPQIKDNIKDIFDEANKIDQNQDAVQNEKMEENISTIKTVLMGE